MNSHQPHVFSVPCPRPTTALSPQLTGSNLITPVPLSHAVTELNILTKKERKKKRVKTTLLVTAESVGGRALDVQLWFDAPADGWGSGPVGWKCSASLLFHLLSLGVRTAEGSLNAETQTRRASVSHHKRALVHVSGFPSTRLGSRLRASTESRGLCSASAPSQGRMGDPLQGEEAKQVCNWPAVKWWVASDLCDSASVGLWNKTVSVFAVNLCCAIVCPSSPAVSLFLLPQSVCLSPSNPPFLSLSLSLSLFPSLSMAQDESASVRPCSSSLSDTPWWSSSSFSNWAPTAGWNYSSPPKLSPLFLNKCGCSNRGVLLIHLSRAMWGACGDCPARQRA